MALGMSVARCQREVNSTEFAEWVAYDRTNPIGPEREDWRAAMLAFIFASAFRRKGRKPFKLDDFLPRFGKPKRRQSVDEMMAVCMAINQSVHGKVR